MASMMLLFPDVEDDVGHAEAPTRLRLGHKPVLDVACSRRRQQWADTQVGAG